MPVCVNVLLVVEDGVPLWVALHFQLAFLNGALPSNSSDAIY